jgi:hypothetical protein
MRVEPGWFEVPQLSNGELAPIYVERLHGIENIIRGGEVVGSVIYFLGEFGGGYVETSLPRTQVERMVAAARAAPSAQEGARTFYF